MTRLRGKRKSHGGCNIGAHRHCSFGEEAGNLPVSRSFEKEEFRSEIYEGLDDFENNIITPEASPNE